MVNHHFPSIFVANLSLGIRALSPPKVFKSVDHFQRKPDRLPLPSCFKPRCYTHSYPFILYGHLYRGPMSLLFKRRSNTPNAQNEKHIVFVRVLQSVCTLVPLAQPWGSIQTSWQRCGGPSPFCTRKLIEWRRSRPMAPRSKEPVDDESMVEACWIKFGAPRNKMG